MYLAVGEPPPKGAERPVRRFVAVERLQVPGAAAAMEPIRARLGMLAQVKDPRFVEVLDLLPSEPAVVTDYVHGVSLARALEELRKAREQVFTEAAVEIGVELAEALHRANSTPGKNGEPLGLVHERLRPAAVMLCPDGAVRILDMAIGRTVALPGSGDGDAQLGLAPEQARKEEVDHRADLFSIGLILYELLMNQPAWRAAEALSPGVGLQALIAAGDLREASRSLEQTLPALGPILRKLLQGRPDDRYRTGAELLVDLRRQLFRERGSYLKEFCEFYFGAIQKLDPAPDLEEHGAGKGRRRSIEERLRDSLAREAEPEPAPAAPKRPLVSPPAGRGQEGADPPRPPPPRLMSPRGEAPSMPQGQGESMSTGGKKAPPRPPVGGPASRAQPFTPPDAGAPRKAGAPLKVVGERRPDETGMLEMVPISADRDKAEASEDPSATAFFAIPAPKADRSRPAASAPPPGPSGPTGVAPPGLGPPPGPPMARPPIGGPVAPQPVQPIVSGPVVSYGNQGAQTPFQVSGPTPTAAPSTDQGDRVRSNRVYAILVAVFLLVAVALVAAVWLIPSLKKEEPKTQAPTTTQPQVVVEKTAKVEQDTAPPPAPAPAPKPKAKTTTPKPAPAPSNGPGTLTVVLADATQATAVEVVCPSGFRQRTALSGGKGSIASVPQEKCTMYFKGGAPAQFAPVNGGRTFSCSIIGTTAVCK